ncbi:MAG TPA: hypothetical protein V6D17_01295 [Candidatus Obscuribacterales bacterium]
MTWSTHSRAYALALALTAAVSTSQAYAKRQQVCDELYSGSIPSRKAMHELKALGIKSIINLRTNSLKGKAALAKELGMNYYHIPTGVFLVPNSADTEAFLRIMSDERNLPAYVFCTLGTDRTAYYVGTYRVACQGWSADRAFQEMRKQGLKGWWPVFRKYDHGLRNLEQIAKRNGNESKSALSARSNQRSVEASSQ